MIIHYIVEENIFVVIVWNIQNIILNIALKLPRKDEYVRLKNYKRKIKLTYMIYADFKSILVPEDNRKQNPDGTYTNKYQKHVASTYSYKLVCVDDMFSKPFKSYLDKDVIFNFIKSKIEERKYCSDI